METHTEQNSRSVTVVTLDGNCFLSVGHILIFFSYLFGMQLSSLP